MFFKIKFIFLFVAITLQLSQIQQIQQKLYSISKQINILTQQNRLNNNQIPQIKIYKMFDTQINNQNANFNTSQVQKTNKNQTHKIFIQSSSGIPTKDGQFFPLILYLNDVYYSIKGQVLINMTHRPHLYYSAKNQNLVIAQLKSNFSIQIFKIAFSYKKLSILIQTTLQIPKGIQTQHYTNFKTVTISGSKHFMFIHKKLRQIHFYSKQGNLLHSKTIKLKNELSNDQEIDKKHYNLQAIKLNTHLIILDHGKLYSLFLNDKNQGLKNCEQIYERIYGLKFDQFDFRVFYAATFNHVYKFDTVSGKIIKKFSFLQPLCDRNFDLFCTIDFHVLKNHIYIQGNRMSYYINGTSNYYQQMKFPFTFQNCQDKSQGRIFFTRKTPQTYIASCVCQNQQKVYLSNLQLQFDQQYSEATDLTKFRIPLIIFSLCLIFYVTFKRNKQESSRTKEEEQLVDKKLQSQILQRMYFEREQRKIRQATNSKSQNIKQNHKNFTQIVKKREMVKQD